MTKKSVLVYDGDCPFCIFWIQRWRKLSKGRVDYLPFQKIKLEESEVTLQQFQSSIWFFSVRGNYYPAARALLLTIEHYQLGKLFLWLMNNIPGMTKLFDWIYYFIARHRSFFWWFTKFVFRVD
ncbi:MAG TPA: DUF393 domain-containing protein [Candidatus Marinimicrobia bacterium]|nr:DUF393 domain-containing protein [Candidatus Neomarinimicrobiota bacterium]